LHLSIIIEQREAQLQALRAQINPHFLFNTLNNIYSLAVVKSDKTAEMVLKLSNLLRYVIYDGKAEQVELKREIAHIQQFIELFQMRSQEPLNIEFNTSGTFNSVKIEPMILIPIVENCFKHCDFDSNEQAFVCIYLQLINGELHFKTVNSKDDRNQQKDRVGGVGLENIRKRLDLKYREKYALRIHNETDKFVVELDLKV
jgi:LytS/YehU family sensor histidine kinase